MGDQLGYLVSVGRFPPDVDEVLGTVWEATPEGQRVLDQLFDPEVFGVPAPAAGRMRAADYERSETLDSEIVALNATTALHTATFCRRRKDASEIGRLRATYVITDGASGRRISALVVHTD